MNKQDILKSVSDTFNVPMDDILGKSRLRHIVIARWVYWQKLFCAGFTYEQCAEATGHKNHTSIGHAIYTLWYDMRQNEALKSKMDEVDRLLELKTAA